MAQDDTEGARLMPKRPTDPNALRHETITLKILTNQPPAVLRDVVKYWLFVMDRQVKVVSVKVKERKGKP